MSVTTRSIPHILIIAGATASGKSALALSIAQSRGGVIINADSQQMYADLRVLTARPTPQDEVLVPHLLYGVLGAQERASAGSWLKLVKMEIDWALSNGQLPVVVGGTGLYLNALVQGIADMPEIPAEVRSQSMSDFDQMGKEAFAERLRAVDPDFFDRLKVYDKQRLIRAYEVWLGSGKPLSWWQKQGSTPAYPAEHFRIFQIELPREEIYRRCDARFVQMVEQGAVDEVRALPPECGGLSKIIGVPELTRYLNGEISLDEAIAAGQQATRNYAKRQMTWFRNQLPEAIKVQEAADILNLVDHT